MEAFKKEKEEIAKQLTELNKLEGHDYEVLRAKQNIAEQFKNIKVRNRLVGELELGLGLGDLGPVHI